jgi:acetylornithine deacetylase
VRLPDSAIVELHRTLVATPSVSGGEGPIAEMLASFLAGHGAEPLRLGNTLLALRGSGPLLLLDTHLDTVPPSPGWTGDPHAARLDGDRIVGLGANDAKASAAAMTAAFLALAERELPIGLALALVEKEETVGEGTTKVLAELSRLGRPIAGAVFGEPTGLDPATVQKGLLILELAAQGQAAHAAHAAALGARNAAFVLARDLVALEGLDLGQAHPELGPTTLQPTVLRGSQARNVTPAEAAAILDLRTTPAAPHAELIERVRAAVASQVRVVSSRLEPRRTPPDALVLRALIAARPEAHSYASPTLSDWALLPASVPALKCGPGRSERSHRPDEFVLVSEILEGARFYERLALELAALVAQTG